MCGASPLRNSSRADTYIHDTPDHLSLNLFNKPSVCAEPVLKSTDQRFSEAAVTLDSVITTKQRWGLALKSHLSHTHSDLRLDLKRLQT